MGERHLKAGETLFSNGERATGAYVLLEGRLAVNDGRIRLGTIDQPGSPVGEMSLLTGSPRIADVVAETDCRLREIQDVEQLFREEPDTALALARGLARRLEDMDRRFLEVRRRMGRGPAEGDDQPDKWPAELEPFRRYLRAWRTGV